MTFHGDAIYWVEVHKISPNPYQPRQDFHEGKLQDLADSIRQYGVLQPLVVTRKEEHLDDGGMLVEYELIAGERRLRAAKKAGISQVPVVIRSDDEDDNVKLELAIIENLQREDLNPIDRARAFARLVEEFEYKHAEVAKKVGRSREYVSNTLRLLQLPQDMMDAVAGGKITEGHTRPLLMLSDRPEEQQTLFKEIVHKKLTVRDAESISRRIAQDKVRKRHLIPKPEIMEMENDMSESLGTRVQIKEKDLGGKIVINFSSKEDLRNIVALFKGQGMSEKQAREAVEDLSGVSLESEEQKSAQDQEGVEENSEDENIENTESQNKEEEGDKDAEDDIYSLENFAI